MKVIIMGCGRVGARVAGELDADGHEVVVIDTDALAFRRLPEGFAGRTVVGDGVDKDVQREAGAEHADVFVAVTQGDNRNAMAAQVAQHLLGVRRAVARIYDPVREEVYRELGLRTVSPTITVAQQILRAVKD